MTRTTPYAHPSDHVDPRMTDEQRRELWALAVDSLWFCEGALMPLGVSMNAVDASNWRTSRGGLLLTRPSADLGQHCLRLRQLLEDLTMGKDE